MKYIAEKIKPLTLNIILPHTGSSYYTKSVSFQASMNQGYSTKNITLYVENFIQNTKHSCHFVYQWWQRTRCNMQEGKECVLLPSDKDIVQRININIVTDIIAQIFAELLPIRILNRCIYTGGSQ